MIFLNYLHDLTFQLGDDFIEVDKIVRVKNNDFKNEYDHLIEKFKNKVSLKDPAFLPYQRAPKYLSHHELHAYSVIQFIKQNNIKMNHIHILVNDGSGTLYYKNNQYVAESISLYYYDFKEKRIHNLFSYLHNLKSNLMNNYSPSLMYLLGCNQLGLVLGEEGKVLAFESKVKEFNSNKEILLINKTINVLLRIFIKNFKKHLIEQNKILYKDKVKNLEHFDYAFKDVFLNQKIIKDKLFNNKYAIAYGIQLLYEKIILFIIDYCIETYNIKDLGGAGGGFFNVKLNNLILNKIEGKLIINPVPGDLGINYYRKNRNVIDSYKNRYILKNKINNFLNK